MKQGTTGGTPGSAPSLNDDARDVPEAPLTLARALPAPEKPKERHEVWQLVYAIQKDLGSANAKMMELRQALASLDLPDPKTVECPRCGLRTKGPRSLAEHMYQSHDGALPEHWGFEA